MKYLRKLNGVAMPCTVQVPVAANQIIVKGDLIVMALGLAKKAGGGPTGVLGIANGPITTGAEPALTEVVEVILLDAETVVELTNYTKGNVDDATAAMCFGAAFYDIRTDGTIDFNDTTGGFLIPIAPSVGGKTQCVICASAFWNKGVTAVVDASTLNLSLNDLSDVTITTPTAGQVLKVNSGADGWENAADAIAE